jgi:hypothetical protein
MITLTCDFNRSPLGLFTTANKLTAWGQLPAGISLTDGRQDGKYWEIKPGGPDGNFCRMKYPGGAFGLNDQWYAINCGAIGDLMTITYKHRWVSPISMPNGGPGKQCPTIQWGPNQSSHPNSIRLRLTWNSQLNGGATKNRNPVIETQGGVELVQPVFSAARIPLDVWEDCSISLKGGPGGSAAWAIGGVPLNVPYTLGTSVLNDSAQAVFEHYSGGGAAVNLTDMFADISGITIQIGSTTMVPVVAAKFTQL